jgi:Uma2 family endonuclease
MSTAAIRVSQSSDNSPLLRAGQRLTQPEFHRRYEAYPDPNVKFELIGGIVYMMSPAGYDHGRRGFEICGILSLYEAATPGVSGVLGATVVLGDRSEPQPDVALLVRPECGGKTRLKRINDKQYIHGPPELVVEVSHSTLRLDLRDKLDDYREGGVHEYIVICVEERTIKWFDLAADDSLAVDSRGVLKSRAFPGLWIDITALFGFDTNRLVSTLQRGLRTKAHQSFVKSLALRRKQVAGRQNAKGEEGK